MDRKEHWEGIYTDKSPAEVSWYELEPTLSLELIEGTGVPKEASIIDVGAGASVLADRLLGAGYTAIAVLDISQKALGRTKERLGKAAEGVEWFVADVTEFVSPHRFDLWHDRAVFHFLTDSNDRRKYIEVLNGTVAPGGHLIIAAFAVGGPKRCSGLDTVQYSAEKLGAELGDGFRLVDEAQELHITPAGAEQKFAYFRFVKG
jgi:SAM-dependent methyltransferase